MESEKVKEIKEKLQEEIFIANSFGNKLRKVPTKELENLLTLINELESENEMLLGVIDIDNEREYRKKFNDEWRKEYQKELDKQGNGHIAGYPDFDLVYKLYFEQKNRIAELEKKIENGTLVPRYSILKDWQYGWWCVCEVDEQSRIIAQCKTEEEAKRKLEELRKGILETGEKADD